MRKINKFMILMVSILMVSSIFAGCSRSETESSFNKDKDITVVARDSASGTRGAFHELMKIKIKEGDKEVDKLVVGALEFDGTDKVITAIEGNKYGIGYVSLGSVSDRIKASNVDGVEANIENVKNKKYKVARPFLLVTKGNESKLVKDFLSFTASKQGQQIVEKKHYISSVEGPAEYSSSNLSGVIKVAGSTSVTPLMELLQEEYKKLNPDVTFEMQSNGSSQGIKSAIEGTYDIGMSSRELKDDEKTQLKEHTLAIDGIAVILNKENPVNDLSSENITKIYTGEITKWSEVK